MCSALFEIGWLVSLSLLYGFIMHVGYELRSVSVG